jgi:predicted nucleic-acid-binding protein
MANNKNGALDTNVLLRLVLGDLPAQAEAVEKLLKPGSIFDVSDIAIFEMVYVLEKIYKLPRTLVSQNIYTVITHPCINCNRKLFSVSLPVYIDNPKLSIVDCALYKYAELNKATPLYTFDAELVRVFSPITRTP